MENENVQVEPKKRGWVKGRPRPAWTEERKAKAKKLRVKVIEDVVIDNRG